MSSEAERGPQLLLVAALVLAAAMLGSLWIVDYVPTSDGPNHVLAGYLTAHLHDANRGYDAFLRPGGPSSSLAFHALFSALVRVMPWRDALRVTLSIGALIWALGFGSLVRALRPERAVLGLLGFATALSWTFYMGLFSYWMCLGADLAVLAFVLRRPVPNLGDRAILGVALAATMLGHSFAAMLLGLMLGVVTLVRPGPRGRLRELGALALVSAPSLAIAYLSARSVTHFVGPQPASGTLLRATWLGARDRLDILWQCFTGGPAWRGVVPLLAAIAGIALTAWRARRGRASREEIAVAAIAALMFVAVLATPIHLDLWQDVSPRFLPLAASLGLVLLPVEELARPVDRGVAAAAIAIFALASTGWSWVHHAALSLASADVMAVAALPIPRRGARLPVILAAPEGSVAQVAENDLVGDLFSVEQGGMTPYFFATRPGLHPFVWTRPRSELFPPFPPPFYGQLVRQAAVDPSIAPRAVHLASLARMGVAYDDVILWGVAADVAAFEARGYVADAKRGGVAILRFAACGLDVDIESPVGREGPLSVEYGWAPLADVSATREVPAGATRASFPDAPCGPVWVRIAGEGVTCDGADEEGRLHARLARDAPQGRSAQASRHVVRCRLKAR